MLYMTFVIYININLRIFPIFYCIIEMIYVCLGAGLLGAWASSPFGGGGRDARVPSGACPIVWLYF